MKKLLAVMAIVSAPAFAKPATVEINNAAQGPQIHPDVYGQFTEHLGDGIYGGLYVGEDSTIPNTRGFRNDVIEALKNLEIPLVRWPGGCFADEYHWRDGIGPKEERPVKVNISWGGTKEDNSFGTHEFFELAEMLGAKAYVNGNLGSGTVQEMAEWLEYMTSDNQTPITELRKKNGREKPWDLAYFAVGNEAWGCGGNMRPEYYADLYNHYATFLKAPEGNKPKMIASGGHSELTDWTDVLSKRIENNIDGISFHYYTLPTADWTIKGKATGFPESEWMSTMVNTLKMDDFLKENIKILDKNDPEGKIDFYVDEWGTWYDTEEATKHRTLYQSNTLRDAMVAAVNFNIFHKYAERVTMTMVAQMVNVLQAMILTDEEKMVLTPTYHIFDMYKVFQGAESLPVKARKMPQYKLDGSKIDALSISAAEDESGNIHLAIANMDPHNGHKVALNLKEGQVKSVRGKILTADKMDAENTFLETDIVKPEDFHVTLNDKGEFDIPSKSIVVVVVE